MSNFTDYIQYRKQKPFYKEWKSNREQQVANKVEYLKNNPVSKDEFNNDIERAKLILNAVNIMDEYSQSRAEEMEQVSESIISLASEPIAIGSLALSGLILKLTKGASEALLEVFAGNMKNALKLLPAAITYLALPVVFAAFGRVWAAKKEIQASREGRQEAMQTDLASAKHFAILNDSQKTQVEQIAKDIKVNEKDSKKIIQNQKKLGIEQALKTIFKKDDAKKYLANVQLNNDKLTEQQILEAKKDKELIQTIVEKIDIASQDYAEDTENAINIVSAIITSGGVVTGAITSFLANKIKPLAKYSKGIGIGLGTVIALLGVLYGAKLQKQSSRVARFKVKQELLNNPEQLIYVDEEKYKNQNATPANTEKTSFIKKLVSMIKNNKEYNEYIKTKNIENIKKTRAKEQIELTQEQLTRAEQLQQNVFNMFNKLDEKSQRYSESAEAVGAIVQSGIGAIITFPAVIGSIIGTFKAKTRTGKIFGVAAYFASLLSTIAINLAITKDQKKCFKSCKYGNNQRIKRLLILCFK